MICIFFLREDELYIRIILLFVEIQDTDVELERKDNAMELDEVLKQRHLAYTAAVDSELIKEMQDTWNIVMQDRTEADEAGINTFLKSYIDFGLLADRDDPSVRYSSKKIDYRGKPTETEHSLFAGEEVKMDYTEVKNENVLMTLELPRHAGEDTLTGWFMRTETGEQFYVSTGKLKSLTCCIKEADHRFTALFHWLAEQKITLHLSGERDGKRLLVSCMHMDEHSQGPMNEDFLQLIMERILTSRDENEEEIGKDVRHSLAFSDARSIETFMYTAGNTLPKEIRSWAYRNVSLMKSTVVSPDEQMHAKHALSIMLKIHWGSSYFPPIDPVEARRILDEELYGMENVKQRIVEIIVQINRTHTLPAYGMLLVGPAGTGKSQISYAVARILKLPYASLSMSTIQEGEALTGSPRIYRNAKPGKIMEALEQAGSSNLVLVINELDKTEVNHSGGSAADTLLTLFDGLGFVDNYVECTIPTYGIYPIATANNVDMISSPLLSRFAVIEIPDYTEEEKYIIFRDYTMPKVLKRIGMREEECGITKDGIQEIIRYYRNEPGVRRLEQAAEHVAANALYKIETEHVDHVVYDADMIHALLAM